MTAAEKSAGLPVKPGRAGEVPWGSRRALFNGERDWGRGEFSRERAAEYFSVPANISVLNGKHFVFR